MYSGDAGKIPTFSAIIGRGIKRKPGDQKKGFHGTIIERLHIEPPKSNLKAMRHF